MKISKKQSRSSIWGHRITNAFKRRNVKIHFAGITLLVIINKYAYFIYVGPYILIEGLEDPIFFLYFFDEENKNLSVWYITKTFLYFARKNIFKIILVFSDEDNNIIVIQILGV